MVAPSILMAIGLIRMLMPRIIKPILLGLLIGTALMIATCLLYTSPSPRD